MVGGSQNLTVPELDSIGTHNSVITPFVAYLDHPSSRGDRLGEAEADLSEHEVVSTSQPTSKPHGSVDMLHDIDLCSMCCLEAHK